MFRATFLDYRPCFLKSAEIRNPFQVLRNTYADLPTAESIVEECWDLLTLAFRPGYWMKHKSPKMLYEKFLKLARLLDAGWLLAQVRATYLTKGNSPQQEDTPNATYTKPIQSATVTEAYSIIHGIYNSSSQFDLIYDLYNIFYQGMAPQHLVFEDTLKESCYTTFQDVNRLILALFVIYKSENDPVIAEQDKAKLEGFAAAGLDLNVCQFNYYDSMAYIFDPFDKGDFFASIAYLKSTSCSDAFWRSNDNPANVLYFMEELQFVMEILWSSMDELQEGNDDKWKVPKKIKHKIKYLPKVALQNPLHFMFNEFKDRGLSDRRADIEAWRLAALDNRWHSQEEHKEVQDFLLRLIEVAYLYLKYKPLDY